MPSQPQCTRLLVIDRSASVLQSLGASHRHAIAYCPFGSSDSHGGRLIWGFTGQIAESFIQAYILGNGYRAYFPSFRRFGSPDSQSPFSEGGLNTYMYCSADPINQSDPSGHWGERLFDWFVDTFPRFRPAPPAASINARRLLAEQERATRVLDRLMIEHHATVRAIVWTPTSSPRIHRLIARRDEINSHMLTIFDEQSILIGNRWRQRPNIAPTTYAVLTGSWDAPPGYQPSRHYPLPPSYQDATAGLPTYHESNALEEARRRIRMGVN